MTDNWTDNDIYNNERYSNQGREELENLISDLLAGDTDYKLMNELLEIYSKHEGVPEIDVDAAWDRFKRNHMGQGEIYLTDI